MLLYVCVRDVTDVVFSVCIVRHGAVGARVWEVSVSSYRCCMFVSCALLMLVNDARGNHMEEAYSRAGLMTALLIAMRVSFCLPHPIEVSAFIICRGLCVCTEKL